MKQRTKILVLAWVLSMIPVALALIPYTLLYWHFEVRPGGSWWTTDLIGNLEWVPVFIVLYVVSMKGLAIVAAHLQREHRHLLERFAEWYW